MDIRDMLYKSQEAFITETFGAAKAASANYGWCEAEDEVTTKVYVGAPVNDTAKVVNSKVVDGKVVHEVTDYDDY